MQEQQPKVILMSPDLTLPDYVRGRIMQHRIELLSCDTLQDLVQYCKQVRPQIAVIYVDSEPEAYNTTLEAIQVLYSAQKMSFLLLASNELDLETLHADTAGLNAIIQRYSDDFQAIYHNLLVMHKIMHQKEEDAALHRIKDTFNHCIQLIHQESKLDAIFEKLINYLPKVILFDHWALCSVDPRTYHIDQFTQFFPPTRQKDTTNILPLMKSCEKWVRENTSFLLSAREDEDLFMKLPQWGWEVNVLYFFPITVKGKGVGGLLAGHSRPAELNSSEIRFLNEINFLIARRILELTIEDGRRDSITSFTDKLISSRFDQESILQGACSRLTEITEAASTIFWQNNKGFGFLFPKYFSYGDKDREGEFSDKTVIYTNRERFLSRLIDLGKVQTFDSVLEDRRFDKATVDAFQSYGYKEILLLPLKIRGEVTGAMIVNNADSNRQLSIIDIGHAEEIVERTQIVLEDAQRARDAELKLKQLARIFELGQEITHDLKLCEILTRVVKNMRKSLGWNDIAILITEPLTGKLKMPASLGFEDTGATAWSIRDGMDAIELQEIIDRCEKISHSHLFSLELQSESTKDRPAIARQNASAEWQKNDLLLVPLNIRNNTLGYVAVYDPVDRMRPTREKMVPLEFYASQAAVAVENSQLYAELSASEERYRSLAQTMSLGLVTCDTERKIVYSNPAFLQLLGSDDETVLNTSLTSYFAESSQDEVTAIFGKLLNGADGDDPQVENVEFDLAGEEETIPVSVYGFPLKVNKKKSGFFLIVTDLRMLKRLERMKADFNSMIVHDLRSPMNVIQGFIELIRNKVVGEVNTEQEELLDIAKENVKKVLSLVDNFLVAAKLDVGRFTIDPKLDEINSLIRNQVDNHRVLVKNKKIRIDIDLDKNLPLLYFDSLRIEQVLNNLLSNAMKFTPENGDIGVRSWLMKHENGKTDSFSACISVRDTGAGIPADQLDGVFEKYEQADSNQNLNIRGTGLGLSICKEIVTLHGGEIWVESEPGVGSTFYFSLPIESELEKLIQ